jgi:hypothetical protein
LPNCGTAEGGKQGENNREESDPRRHARAMLDPLRCFVHKGCA